MKCENSLPLIPVRGMVVFPASRIVLTVGRPSTLASIERAIRDYDSRVACFAQIRAEEGNPRRISDLHKVGTICRIERCQVLSDGSAQVEISSLGRAELLELTGTESLVATVMPFPEDQVEGPQLSSLHKQLSERLKILVSRSGPSEMLDGLQTDLSLWSLTALICQFCDRVDKPSGDLVAWLDGGSDEALRELEARIRTRQNILASASADQRLAILDDLLRVQETKAGL